MFARPKTYLKPEFPNSVRELGRGIFRRIERQIA